MNKVVHIPPGSKYSLSVSCMISSLFSTWCSRHVSPLSERKMTISRSFPRSDAKCGTSMITGPINLAATGPNSSTRLASASPLLQTNRLTNWIEWIRSNIWPFYQQFRTFHELRRVQRALWFHITARDPRWLRCRSRWYNYTNARMTTSAHRSTTCINQKGNQEAKREFAIL